MRTAPWHVFNSSTFGGAAQDCYADMHGAVNSRKPLDMRAIYFEAVEVGNGSSVLCVSGLPWRAVAQKGEMRGCVRVTLRVERRNFHGPARF